MQYDDQVMNQIHHARIPERFTEADLRSREGPMVDIARNFVANWPHTDSMLLTGPTGTGKTHVACATVNEIHHIHSDLHTQALFFNLNTDLPKVLDMRYFKRYDEYRNTMQALETRDLLIVDDLGHVPTVEWAKDVIYRIYEARYQNGFATITTLNGNYLLGEDGLPDLSPLSALFNEPFIRRLVDTSPYTFCG